nr:Aerobic C4-dicarboxylate transporter [Raoultella sp. NCTC 9187]
MVLLLSSKGAAGVTGSGFIVLAATISAVGHLPVAGLALILVSTALCPKRAR